MSDFLLLFSSLPHSLTRTLPYGLLSSWYIYLLLLPPEYDDDEGDDNTWYRSFLISLFSLFFLEIEFAEFFLRELSTYSIFFCLLILFSFSRILVALCDGRKECWKEDFEGISKNIQEISPFLERELTSYQFFPFSFLFRPTICKVKWSHEDVCIMITYLYSCILMEDHRLFSMAEWEKKTKGWRT